MNNQIFDINNIPLDDQKVYKNIYHKGNTFGIFQVDSAIGVRTCKRFQPSNIEDIGLVISIIRPGTLKSYNDDGQSMTQVICNRKHGIEKNPEPPHPSLETILKDTYYINVYQETSIKIVQILAGFDGNKSDELRRGIGKKRADIISGLEKDFLNGCKHIGLVSEDIAKKIFDNIKASNRYAFNKSHAIEYAIISYQTAYLKYYYPLQFFTACLQSSDSHIKPFEYVKQCVLDTRNNNVEIVIPDIRDKQIIPYIKNNKYVSFGLSNIRGIGESATRSLFLVLDLVEERLKKPISEFSWTDFLFLISQNIGSDTVTGLIYSGALDYYKKPRSAMFFEFKKWGLLTKGEKNWIIEHHTTFPFNSLLDAVIAVSATKKNGGGCHTQKKVEFCLGLAESIKNPTLNIKDSPYFISMMEEKYLGSSISCVKHEGMELSDMANYTCEQINKGWGSQNISLAIEIVRYKEHKIKKGQSEGKYMAFLDIFDQTGSLNESAVIFAEKWEEIRDNFDEKASYFIICYRSKKNSLVIENIQKIC